MNCNFLFSARLPFKTLPGQGNFSNNSSPVANSGKKRKLSEGSSSSGSKPQKAARNDENSPKKRFSTHNVEENEVSSSSEAVEPSVCNFNFFLFKIFNYL